MAAIFLYTLHAMTAAYAIRIQAADFVNRKPEPGQRLLVALVTTFLVALSVMALLGARSA